MELMLTLYEKLKAVAFVPWFAIADTQINLFRVMGLVLIVLVVWRIGILFEFAIARIGREQDKTPRRAGMR